MLIGGRWGCKLSHNQCMLWHTVRNMWPHKEIGLFLGQVGYCGVQSSQHRERSERCPEPRNGSFALPQDVLWQRVTALPGSVSTD